MQLELIIYVWLQIGAHLTVSIFREPKTEIAAEVDEEHYLANAVVVHSLV